MLHVRVAVAVGLGSGVRLGVADGRERAAIQDEIQIRRNSTRGLPEIKSSQIKSNQMHWTRHRQTLSSAGTLLHVRLAVAVGLGSGVGLGVAEARRNTGVTSRDLLYRAISRAIRNLVTRNNSTYKLKQERRKRLR
jgi:hypothetical protein